MISIQRQLSLTGAPEHRRGNDSEMTAVAALTSLTRMPPVVAEKPLVTAAASLSEEDFRGVQDDNEEEIVIPERFTKSGRKRAVPFPLKLLKVLSHKEYAHIIAWMPSGKSFQILKPKQFTNQVLPVEFKSAKFSSFTRKLHRWGFMRHYRGEDAGAYFRKDFQKGRVDLVEEMTCYKGPENVEVAPSPKKYKTARKKPAVVRMPPGRRSPLTPSSPPKLFPRAPQLSSLARSNIPAASSLVQTFAAPIIPTQVDFDAAIERDVARRLRSSYAAPNGGQLLAIQLEQQRLKTTLALHRQIQQHQKLCQLQQQQQLPYAAYALQNQTCPPMATLLLRTASRGTTSSTLPQAAPKIKLDTLPRVGYAARSNLPPPSENIQGAKTAQ